jgi:hypothetical protein
MKLLKLFAICSLILFTFEDRLVIWGRGNDQLVTAEGICGYYSVSKNGEGSQNIASGDSSPYSACNEMISKRQNDFKDCQSYDLDYGEKAFILYILSHLKDTMMQFLNSKYSLISVGGENVYVNCILSEDVKQAKALLEGGHEKAVENAQEKLNRAQVKDKERTKNIIRPLTNTESYMFDDLEKPLFPDVKNEMAAVKEAENKLKLLDRLQNVLKLNVKETKDFKDYIEPYFNNLVSNHKAISIASPENPSNDPKEMPEKKVEVVKPENDFKPKVEKPNVKTTSSKKRNTETRRNHPIVKQNKQNQKENLKASKTRENKTKPTLYQKIKLIWRK